MPMFSQVEPPRAILSVEDLERGIKTVRFYIGQVQGALRLIEEEDYSPPEISERSLLLAQTLESCAPTSKTDAWLLASFWSSTT